MHKTQDPENEIAPHTNIERSRACRFQGGRLESGTGALRRYVSLSTSLSVHHPNFARFSATFGPPLTNCLLAGFESAPKLLVLEETAREATTLPARGNWSATLSFVHPGHFNNASNRFIISSGDTDGSGLGAGVVREPEPPPSALEPKYTLRGLEVVHCFLL